MTKGVIYCRVPIRRPLRSKSLSAQLKSCIAYCERNGIVVEETFVEEGKDILERPQFRALLTHCNQNREVQAVILSPNLFGGNVDEYLGLLGSLKRLNEMGLAFHVADGSTDNSRNFGRFIEMIRVAFEQLENELSRAGSNEVRCPECGCRIDFNISAEQEG